MSATQGLFGGGAAGDEQKAKAEDFINRYQTGKPSEGYTEKEAVQALEEVSKVATPEQMQQAFQQSVAALPEDERAQFNQMLEQRKSGAGMVDITRSGERTEVTSRETDSSGGAAAAPGLDDLLGGLLGGASGGSGGSGGLGDILGGLLGGAAGASGTTGATAAPAGESQDSGGGGIADLLGGLLSSPAGKAVLAGTAAFAMKEVLGKK